MNFALVYEFCFFVYSTNAVDLSFCFFVLMNIFYDTNNLRPLPLRGRDRVGGCEICKNIVFYLMNNFYKMLYRISLQEIL